MTRRQIDEGLIVLSMVALVAGLVFPIQQARDGSPFYNLFILVISWPAWTVGAIAGAAVGIRGLREQPPPSTAKWGWSVCGANVLAAVATLLFLSS